MSEASVDSFLVDAKSLPMVNLVFLSIIDISVLWFLLLHWSTFFNHADQRPRQGRVGTLLI